MVSQEVPVPASLFYLCLFQLHFINLNCDVREIACDRGGFCESANEQDVANTSGFSLNCWLWQLPIKLLPSFCQAPAWINSINLPFWLLWQNQMLHTWVWFEDISRKMNDWFPWRFTSWGGGCRRSMLPKKILIFLWCYSINSGMLKSLFLGLLQSENMYILSQVEPFDMDYASVGVTQRSYTVQSAHTCHNKSCAMNGMCSQEWGCSRLCAAEPTGLSIF